MDLQSYFAATRIGSNKRFPFRVLMLVNSRKPSADKSPSWPAGWVFPSAQMRHNFAIWALERSGTFRRPLHLYYCVRCKWAFRIDDRNGSVTPLDPDGNPLPEFEAAERLATFGVGPCPAFNRLIASARLTEVVTRREALRARFAALIHAMGQIWKGSKHEARNNLRSTTA